MLTDYQKGSIFGAVLLWVAFAAAYSTTPYQQIYEQPSTHSARDHYQEETIWDTFFHDPVAIFTCALAVIGAGQLCLFFWQLGLIRESLSDAKKSADAAKEAADATARQVKIAEDCRFPPRFDPGFPLRTDPAG
jgi:hypothetical protein